MLLRMADSARVFAAHAQLLVQLAVESLRAEGTTSASDEAGDPVLLLHGLGGSPRMLRPLGRYLRRDLGRPTLDIALGIGLGDIRDLAIAVQRLLEEREVSRCDVIGYSMGGLVAAYLLKCLDHGRRVRSVVTLGTPHGGVPFVSRFPASLAYWFRSALQMRSGSPFLDQLRRLPPPAGVRLLSIAGADDALVPPGATHLAGPGCKNLVVPDVDHLRLLTSRRVFRAVGQALRPVQVVWLPVPIRDSAREMARSQAAISAAVRRARPNPARPAPAAVVESRCAGRSPAARAAPPGSPAT